MNTFNNKVVSKIHGEKKTMLFILLVWFILSWNSKLLMVYQVGRHGYRSPKSKFEGLIEDESQNFNKFKELLTNYGLQQTFERGENIMKRYKSILKDVDIKNVKVKSSFIARTRFSALSQLLGMFGSVNCKNEMILFTSANHTLELEDLEDIPQKLREWLSEFLPYVDVDEKATSIFNMGFMNWTLYSTMLGEYTPEELLTLSDLKHKIIDWTNENYPIKISELNHFWGTIRSNYEHGLKLNSKISQNDSYIVDICKSFSYERKRHETAVNEIVSLLNWKIKLK